MQNALTPKVRLQRSRNRMLVCRFNQTTVMSSIKQPCTFARQNRTFPDQENAESVGRNSRQSFLCSGFSHCNNRHCPLPPPQFKDKNNLHFYREEQKKFVTSFFGDSLHDWSERSPNLSGPFCFCPPPYCMSPFYRRAVSSMSLFPSSRGSQAYGSAGYTTVTKDFT